MCAMARDTRRHYFGCDPAEAVDGAEVVVTDTFVSMGQELTNIVWKPSPLPGRRGDDGSRGVKATSCSLPLIPKKSAMA